LLINKEFEHADFQEKASLSFIWYMQEVILEYVNIKTADIEDTTNAIKNQINKLKEYRQSLIFEAVTGKIDVRE
jgi:hypothetical protein